MNFFGPAHIYLFIYNFITFFIYSIMYCSYKDIDSLYLTGGFFFSFFFFSNFYFFEKMAQFSRHIFEFLKKAEFGRFRS